MSAPEKKIGLIGLGPHAKRIYCPYIEDVCKQMKARFSVLVELEEKEKDVQSFFEGKEFPPEQVFLVEGQNQINPTEISDEVAQKLLKTIEQNNLSHVIVSTEPKAHKVYADFFIKNRIPVLLDKPLTAPVGSNVDINAAEEVYQDFDDLNRLAREFASKVYVQAQRREHPFYKQMFDIAENVISEFGIPVTYFDLYHGDGTWNMPHDFEQRENHPYKYGYGKLLHSGYHFVDVFSWMMEVQARTFGVLSLEHKTTILTPDQQFKQLNSKGFYEKMFNENVHSPDPNITGEVDSYTDVDVRHGETGDLLTKGRMDLLQGGFTQRAWFHSKQDTYKGNGRIRHERMNMQIGPLMNLQVHSYQSDQVKTHKGTNPGEEDHLDLHIYRNKEFLKDAPFDIIRGADCVPQEEGYIGQNEVPRRIIFDQFLDGEDSDAELHHQKNTNRILSDMYKSVITGSPSITNVTK